MSLANEQYEVPKDQKIKQLYPIPEHSTVMLECEDDAGKMLWRDYRETPCTICLALVDEVYDGKERTIVRPYNLTTGQVLNDNSMVVQIQRCPKCGKPMKPQAAFCEPYEVSFTCDCGSCLGYWDNDWSKESE